MRKYVFPPVSDDHIADGVTSLALAGQSQHEILMPGMILCPWTLGIVHRDSGGLLTF